MSTISGDEYLAKLLKYLTTHKHRLTAPPFPSLPSPSAAGLPVGNIWQQSYTIATLGLDPTSSPLNPGLATVFSLGLAGTAGVPTVESTRAAQVKPLTLRLPPDRILYLLLLFQASSNTTLSTSPLIRPTDEPLPPGVSVLPSDYRDQGEGKEGDVQSVRSWVGSLRSVGGVFGGKKGKGEGWTGWFGGRKREEMDFGASLIHFISPINTCADLMARQTPNYVSSTQHSPSFRHYAYPPSRAGNRGSKSWNGRAGIRGGEESM